MKDNVPKMIYKKDQYDVLHLGVVVVPWSSAFEGPVCKSLLPMFPFLSSFLKGCVTDGILALSRLS
jgi:hypothetical protein